MRLPGPLLQARVIQRPNRFALWAELAGARVYAHVPNSGRMRELIYPGAPICLRATGRHPDRPTTHQLVLARHNRHWVCLDTRLAPRLCAEYLAHDSHPLGLLGEVRYEITRGASRFDLLATTDRGSWLIETKSVTLWQDGRGLFPDAPTVRGARHLRELTAHVQSGGQAAAVFVAMRADITAIAPNEATDPAFATALREAQAAGVLLMGLSCRVTVRAVTPQSWIPVHF